MDRHHSGAYKQQGVLIVAGDGSPMAEAGTLDDARRVVAALNAVDGVPTAALEGGALDEARKLLVTELAPYQIKLARARKSSGKPPGA